MDNQPTALRSFNTPDRAEIWLYSLMLLVPEAIYGWLIYSTPALRTTPTIFWVSGLFLAHGVLYLLAARLPRRISWLISYGLVQATLIFTISLLTSATPQPITLFLYASLAAQMVALWQGQLRPALLVSLLFLAVVVIDYVYFWGWSALVGFLLVVLPMTAFLMTLVYLYMRQSQARQEAQQLLAALERANHQLSEYATRVEDLTLTAERQRMARELHDTLAQGLAGLILQLEAVESHLGRGNIPRAQGIISQVMQRARLTLADARHAIDDLRVGNYLLDANQAVSEELQRFSDSTGLRCHAMLKAPATLPTAVQETVLRTVSEGLTNIARHAQARQVWVTLQQAEESLTTIVRDDGVGFDPAEANRVNGHYGLLGLYERAQLAGGSLTITSSPGTGTTLTLHLPLIAAAMIKRHHNG